MTSADPPQQIGFTPAESTPRFPHDPKPPAGAPNVVAIVLDDTGFGHLGSFGSDIATPHLDRLAAQGAPFTRFHVTSLCSPTRASFFTGRNHHAVGMGFLADIPLAFPGYTARLPKTAAALPRLLRDAGYSTLAVGKWHLTPRWQRSAAGPFETWPLGVGFERHYGFLQGDANHWAPTLVSDNHYVDPPRRPEEGYHLSEDLADTAIAMVQDQQQGAPGKPFFLYFALGAMHSPHHVAPEWVAPYAGRFDHGWDEWRREVFDRQLEKGIVPEGTVLTERPSWVQGWHELGADERRMQARQQEVFAGFLTHTDAQIGRVLTSLETSGLLDNTLVMVFSDNGASAEGGKEGSLNEHRFTAHIRESLADNLAAYDDWGGFSTYNHYSWAWAWAGNTPHKLWKRYTWLGGTRTPLIVHWPGHVADPGAARAQFTHVVDLAPTILAAVGIEMPDAVDGVPQQVVDGVDLLTTLADPSAPEVHRTQYFEMLGSRSIFSDGWKATTNHISSGVLDEEELAVGSRSFDDDRWELFNLAEDFSEAVDRAADEPARLEELIALWSAEAERNQVLPISDGMLDRFSGFIPPAWPAGTSRTFRPGGGPVHDESIPLLWGGFRLTASVEAPGPSTDGVIGALGDWFGGYALYVTEGIVRFTFARAADALDLAAGPPLEAGPHQIEVAYALGAAGAPGRMVLLVDGAAVDEIEVEGSLPFAVQHGGAGLRLGRDAGFPVSRRYAPPAPFNGEVHHLTIDTPGAPPPDGADEIRAEASTGTEAVILPDAVRRILGRAHLAHLVTLNADGSPQVTIVWVGLDGDEVVAGHLGSWAKVRNMARDDRVALSIETGQPGPGGLSEYLVLYGTARVTQGGAPELLQHLAHTYIGPDVRFPPMEDPPPGYVTRITVDRIAGNGEWDG